ncbi:MAG: right-handed parallel beta-helix repeat-containing protein [Pseudomonadota bacterium]
MLIINGENTVIDGIAFKNAAVPDKNGAGIRLQAANLTVRNAHFTGNEIGILATTKMGGQMLVENSRFEQNGLNYNPPGHGLYVGQKDMLIVRNSVFTGTKIGHHVKSRAFNTIIENSQLIDGPTGTSSYAVDIPSGGGLLLRGNEIQKGPNSDNSAAAVSIGSEGVINPNGEILIEGNRFTNDYGRQVVFIRNSTDSEVIYRDNEIIGNATKVARFDLRTRILSILKR